MSVDEFPITRQDILLRRELIAQGYNDRAVWRMVKAGILVRVRYGAYVDADLVRGLDDVAMSRVRARAVLKTAHPTSVLSHHSALAEYDVPLWGVDLTETHLARTDDSGGGRREAGVAHHSSLLPETQTRVQDDVPVVSPARAGIEVMAANTVEVGLVLVNGLLHKGLSTVGELTTLAKETDHWPDSLTTRIVLSLADVRMSSVAESRVHHLCHAQRLPKAEPQVEVRNEFGDLLGIVDFLWRNHGVFLEFDGRIKYDKFRRHEETLDQYLRREKLREERICAATGWVCIRISWADLEHPAATARRIHSLLVSRKSAS
ncbi:type IV toxin-antitoxin system AbiEi family antitoxin domain-containing protein [Nocardioides sp.]|uniref:type IV toxin-antitoxin system AbiEi family antitoxin domain-containing protein n=1 Tax=Nocardioides sp. TaxID=35761 RepID=UPI002CC2D112|nr:type IV toxin-antitoxin system AbiEi family antitoxin domain-containing protein [Nocardioides sp.]HXH81172.1 type IV toxin-antitoxin system AbiEi family antitoxin domain-containing protein [Nocardioides sp.]